MTLQLQQIIWFHQIHQNNQIYLQDSYESDYIVLASIFQCSIRQIAIWLQEKSGKFIANEATHSFRSSLRYREKAIGLSLKLKSRAFKVTFPKQGFRRNKRRRFYGRSFQGKWRFEKVSVRVHETEDVTEDRKRAGIPLDRRCFLSEGRSTSLERLASKGLDALSRVLALKPLSADISRAATHERERRIRYRNVRRGNGVSDWRVFDPVEEEARTLSSKDKRARSSRW